MITLGQFCQEAGLPATFVPDLVAELQRRELAELAAHEARMQRCAGRPNGEVLPLMEDGHTWGEVEARIPKALFYNLLKRKGFGYEGLVHEDGIRDILKDNPQCRVKTVSGKTVVGWVPGRRTVKKYG